jgi:hypothetical protein
MTHPTPIDITNMPDLVKIAEEALITLFGYCWKIVTAL